jgi:predicted regulator of Ras-like GTPase activity (Roadblock/LC7/MglB family)
MGGPRVLDARPVLRRAAPAAEAPDDPTSRVLEYRLNAYLAWLKSSFGARGSFVVDGDGLVLANRDTPETHTLATVAMGHAQRMVREYVGTATEGNTMIEVDEATVLQLIHADTRDGRLGVGLVLSSPLDRPKSDLVRRMLRKVVGWEQPETGETNAPRPPLAP